MFYLLLLKTILIFLQIIYLLPHRQLVIVTGNPGVFQGYPYPYPHFPVPAEKGMGFAGSGYGFCRVCRVLTGKTPFYKTMTT
jgi:hypothetical protein